MFFDFPEFLRENSNIFKKLKIKNCLVFLLDYTRATKPPPPSPASGSLLNPIFKFNLTVFILFKLQHWNLSNFFNILKSCTKICTAYRASHTILAKGRSPACMTTYPLPRGRRGAYRGVCRGGGGTLYTPLARARTFYRACPGACPLPHAPGRGWHWPRCTTW